MDDTISKVDNKYIDSVNVEILAKDNKKKIKGEDFIINKTCQREENTIVKNGEIIVTSVLDCGENEYLQGIKINLYKINGLSPVLIASKITDEEGKVVFSEIEEGCYRIIEIVDKRYFEKPKYISWNEIIIDGVNKSQELTIVNRIKRFESQDKHKHLI